MRMLDITERLPQGDRNPNCEKNYCEPSPKDIHEASEQIEADNKEKDLQLIMQEFNIDISLAEKILKARIEAQKEINIINIRLQQNIYNLLGNEGEYFPF